MSTLADIWRAATAYVWLFDNAWQHALMTRTSVATAVVVAAVLSSSLPSVLASSTSAAAPQVTSLCSILLVVVVRIGVQSPASTPRLRSARAGSDVQSIGKDGRCEVKWQSGSLEPPVDDASRLV
ncbi:hypothetical protein DAEQUDRAFT_364455 [Daedalea quercina L-15889]|uniref:Uncharacterized protein n=1 Tax=Daedalea quercina L-15889 TaxID=1314783 RepID=A0A165TUL2_9APHY|nr:hypothetical protein DAEQUDRAFT_364455 [Daedalea quercina L-15889]